jgi:hypothetical protein
LVELEAARHSRVEKILVFQTIERPERGLAVERERWVVGCLAENRQWAKKATVEVVQSVELEGLEVALWGFVVGERIVGELDVG